MARKVRQAREVITRDQYQQAAFDVLYYMLNRLLCEIPKAQFIYLAVEEFYDDDNVS